MRLLPRFGLQDLHDGLSTKNENELVTTVSCFSNLCFDGTVNLTYIFFFMDFYSLF